MSSKIKVFMKYTPSSWGKLLTFITPSSYGKGGGSTVYAPPCLGYFTLQNILSIQIPKNC